MTNADPSPICVYDAQGMQAIEDELAARGMTTVLTDARVGLDLTAVLSPSGRREAELFLNEDGYAELRYWNPPGASPAEVTAIALRALEVVTSPAPPAGTSQISRATDTR